MFSSKAPTAVEEPSAPPAMATTGITCAAVELGLDAEPSIAKLEVSAYTAAARIALPRLRRFLEPSHFGGNVRQIRRAATPETMVRRLSATLAVGMMLEHDPAAQGNELLDDCVRRSLIHWQMSLRCDGRPFHRRADSRRWHAINADLIAHLLNETSTFHNPMLLDDFGRHLRWLAAGPRYGPSVEAALVIAMATGALIVRDVKLLGIARERLATLLSAQTEGGWFPERGGADLGRLSYVIDSLARLYAHHEWQEVLSPIERAIRFLFSFVPPDGRMGGCFNSCGTEFVSPYGMEIMASRVPEAATFASSARQRCIQWTSDKFSCWSDETIALMAPRIVAASTAAAHRLPVGAAWPWMTNSHQHFPEAGLSVHVTDAYHVVVAARRGGALHLTWRSGAPPLVDAGIVVVCAHSARTSSSGRLRREPIVGARRVFCESVLRRGDRDQDPVSAKTGRETDRNSALDDGWDRTSSNKRTRWSAGRVGDLAHDTCSREIRFDDETVSIRDVVRCRLPCQVVVCQLPHPAASEPTVTERAPIYITGGKQVTIERSYRGGELIDVQTNRA
ncbi:MAG: hypothetical protein IH987_02790 [Planctomycetes bacterium]|nr:hypothetical protein [Planctomycetota bacterium]